MLTVNLGACYKHASGDRSALMVFGAYDTILALDVSNVAIVNFAVGCGSYLMSAAKQ